MSAAETADVVSGPAGTGSDVFVSYSRADREFAVRLTEGLRARGREAWVDWQDIPPTAEWMAEIQEAIDAADTVVVVLSPDLIRSTVCSQEIEHALEANKRIVPLLYREVDAASVPVEIAKRNWLLFGDEDGFEQALDQLVGVLDTDLEQVKFHTGMLVKAREWDTAGRPGSRLLRGSDLAAAERWLGEPGRGVEPTALQRQYVLASRQAASRRQRLLVATAVVALAIVAVLGVLALLQRNDARDQRKVAVEQRQAADEQRAAAQKQEKIAQHEARVAQSQRLAIQAETLAPTELDLALLLGVEARHLDDSVEARSGLLSALTKSPTLTGFDQRFGTSLSAMGLSSDGTTLAIGGEDGSVREWSLATGEPLSESVDTGVGFVLDTAFSPDGNVLAVAGDGGVRLLDARTLEPRTALLDDGIVEWIAFSPDGKTIASSTSDGLLQLRSVPSGRKLAPPLRVSPSRATSIAFLPGGQELVVGTAEGTAVTVDARSGTLIDAPLRVTTAGATYALAVSPDGKILASGAEDGKIVLWDRATRSRRQAPLDYHTSAVYVMAFSPDGKLLASAGDGGTIAVWDARTGARLGPPLAGRGFVSDLAFTGPRRLISAAGGEIATWDLDSYTLGQRFLPGRDSLATVALSPDGSTIAAADLHDGIVRLWDVSDRRALGPPVETGLKRVLALDWISNDRIAAAGAAEVERGKPKQGRVVTFSPGGAPSGTITTGPEAVNAADVSPSGALLATGTRSGLLTFRNMADGQPVGRPIDTQGGSLISVAFSPDGQLLATGGGTGAVTLWRVGDRRKLWTSNTASNVNAIAWLPDGKSLVGVNGVGSLVLLSADSGETLNTGDLGLGELLGVAVSEDGSQAAVSSLQGSVGLVDLPSTSLAFSLPTHSGRANGVHFVDHGHGVASVGNDGALVLSDIEPSSWDERACRLAGRTLTPEEIEQYLGTEKESPCAQ